MGRGGRTGSGRVGVGVDEVGISVFVEQLGLRGCASGSDLGSLGGPAEVGEDLPDGFSLGEEGDDAALFAAVCANEKVVGEHGYNRTKRSGRAKRSPAKLSGYRPVNG